MTLWYPIRDALRHLAWRRLLTALLVSVSAALAAPALAADSASESSGAQILESFEKSAPPAPAVSATDLSRRWVMFALGAPLLVLLLITGSLGIAMGVFGKPVYLAHMVCAALSVTLAIVHAIVGLVWFRPF